MIPLLARSFRWLVAQIGGMTLVRVTLLWISLAGAGMGLAVVVNDLRGVTMIWTAAWAVMLAWLIARMRISPWGYMTLALFSGLAYLLVTYGQLGPLILGLMAVVMSLGWELIRARFHLDGLDLQPLTAAWSKLVEATGALSERISLWLRAVLAGQKAFDPLVVLLLWALLLWGLAAWAVWFTRRGRNVLLAVLPLVTLLGYDIFYTGSERGVVYLVLTCGSALLLQAASRYDRAREQWLAEKTDQVPTEWDVGIAIGVIAGVLMLAAYLTPSVSIREVQRAIDRWKSTRQEPGLAESLGLEQAPSVGGGIGYIPQAVLPAEHLLGATPMVSREMVMTIQVEGYGPVPYARFSNNAAAYLPPRYYWRSLTYDQYNGHGWFTYPPAARDYASGEPVIVLPKAGVGSRLTSVHVQTLQDLGGYLFYTGELISAEPAYRVVSRGPGDVFGASISADNYSFEARLAKVTVAQLRLAGTGYPQMILDEYLQLPSDLPQRVRNLAARITAVGATTYDRAALIETYLRQNYPYDLEVPLPPADRDVADYFLFDLKKGYCDYYATAMTVMARAVGIPARLVTGYSSGSFDLETGSFVIRRRDAHSWVEIYFPGIGWEEFEPTAGLPAIERPGEVLTGGQNPNPASGGQGHGTPFPPAYLRPLWVLLGSLSLVLLGLLVAWLLRLESWLLLRQPVPQALAIIYRRLYRQGYAWDLGQDAARTPGEFAAALGECLRPLAAGPKMEAMVTDMLASIHLLTDLYTRSLFAPGPVGEGERRRAVQSWLGLRRLLFWARIRKRIRK